MPELPEIETVRSGLEKNIIGKNIDKVSISDKNLRFPYPNNFAKDLEKTTIKSIDRRARYLLINLESEDLNKKNLYKKTLLIHFGMTGKLNFFTKKPENNKKHDHILPRS